MDPGHHEEVRNGPENNIHIREVDFQVSEKFGIFLVETVEGSRRFRGGPTYGPSTWKGLVGHGGAAWPNGPGATAHKGPSWLNRGNPRGLLGGQVAPLSPLAAAPSPLSQALDGFGGLWGTCNIPKIINKD